MKKIIRIFCIFGVILAVAYCLYVFNVKNKNQIDNPSVSNNENSNQDGADNEESQACREYFVEKMTKLELQRDLIDKIFDCNEMVFTSWYEYNPKELDRQIGALSFLKGKLDIQRRLLTTPEAATLVAAAAAIDIESAKSILDSIPEDAEDGRIVRSLYAFYATPQDSIHLARMLCYGSNEKYIIELYKHSCGDISFLRFFELLEENREAAPHAAQVYQKWLYSLLDEMLAMDPESDDADNNYLLLASQSEPLMEALKSNKEFCNNFFIKYWRDFSDILKSIPPDDEFRDSKISSYISNSDVWKFLIAYPETGAQLLKTYGENAPIILMNKEFLDNPLVKNRLATLMLNANQEQEQAFLQIPDEAFLLYAKFLEKRQNLDDSVLLKGTVILANAEDLSSNTCAKQKLEYWESLSNEALLRDDDFTSDNVTLATFLPGYDMCVILYKGIDGRKITKSDIAMAGIDTVFLVPEIIAVFAAPSSGGSSVVMVESAKGAAKGAVKVGVKTAAKQAAKQAVKDSSKTFLKRMMLAGVKASRQTARKEWRSMIKGVANKLSKIDITSKIQSIYKNSPLKNATFKRLTGLDARIFMRPDRRIYFNLSSAINKMVGSNITKTVAEDVFFGAAGYLVLSTTEAQDAIGKIIKNIDNSIRQKSDEDNWKSDLSAWWMLNQYGDAAVSVQSSNKTKKALE